MENKSDSKKYPYFSSFGPNEFELFFYVSGWNENGPDHTVLQNMKIVPTTGYQNEMVQIGVNIPDSAIFGQILAWAPQKINGFIYDLLRRFILIHWLEWLSFATGVGDFWLDQASFDPELLKSYKKMAMRIETTKSEYYRAAQRRWEKTQGK